MDPRTRLVLLNAVHQGLQCAFIAQVSLSK